MAIKKFKPMTPGTRFRSVVDNSDILTKKAPEKSLVEGASKSGGRTDGQDLAALRLVRKDADVLLELEGLLVAETHDLAVRIVDVKRGPEELEDLAPDRVARQVEHDP